MKNKRISVMIMFALALVLALGISCNAQAEGGQVSGIAWVDKDADGLIGGERVLPGVLVTLYREAEDGTAAEIVSARTNDDGFYAFSIAEDGQYFLRFSLPENYRFSLHGLDSSVLPAEGKISQTPVFSMTDGQVLTMNAGALTGNSYVSFVAFEDLNLNGGRMDREPRIRNVQIELYYEFNGTHYLVSDAVTDKNGETSMSHVSPGTYYLKAVLPENYVAGPLGTKFTSFYNCMNPSIDNICYSGPFTITTKGSNTVGIGVVTTGSLNGSIWQDDNGNQRHDAAEAGCTEAVVSLYAQSLDITRTTQVAADGTFSFTGLQPAQYELIFQLPQGMIFANSGDSQLNNIASTASMPVTVEALKTTEASPVGATIASRVEVLLTDVSNYEVHPLAGANGVFEQNGEVIGTAVSDENGLLVFPIARSGEGTVSVTLPDGYVVAQEGGIFPYENAATTAAFTLSVPLNETVRAEGFAIQSASVSGRLVEDPTNTGMIDSSNLPLAGFTVQAIDADGRVALETVTNENGEYTLSPLVPETYYIRFLLDDRYIATPCLSDESSEHNAIYIQEPLFGETDAIVLYDGQQKTSVNGALFRAGIVEGQVLLNPEMDQLATNAGGAVGITVTLLDADGNVWQDYAYDVTDENGAFCIKGILPGTYFLQYELPADHAFVAPAGEGNLYYGEKFTVENGSQIQQQPIGVVKTSTIGGIVSDYTSGTGVLADMTLTCQRTGEEMTVQTDEKGAYSFRGLLPGDYTLAIRLADGYLFADSPESIMPYLNESACAIMLNLPMGTVENGCNIIASQPVDWQFTLFNDANNNGEKDNDETLAANRNVQLFLRSDLIGNYTSDADGIVRLSGIIPAQYTATPALNEREILAAAPGETSFTVNADGLMIALLQYAEISGNVWSLDGTSNGIAGVAVTLMQNKAEIATAITDEEGSYRFENLLCGDYQLRAQLPEGYLFARLQDAQARASYILSQTDGSLLFGVIPLQYGQQFVGVDIGIGGIGSIGDVAWLDENKNGMQDIGEPFLPGIQIELYQHGILVASTQTDAYGRYQLTNLYPGSYEMRVTLPKEIKPTVQQTEYSMVASILPESAETTVIVEEVIVPSMGRNLNMDLGFVLKKKNVYPDCMKDIPQKDWTPFGRTEED